MRYVTWPDQFDRDLLHIRVNGLHLTLESQGTLEYVHFPDHGWGTYNAEEWDTLIYPLRRSPTRFVRALTQFLSRFPREYPAMRALLWQTSSA